MIKGSFCFGKTKVNILREIKSSNLDYKKLYSKTGIKYIHRSSDRENPLTLGVKAAKNFIKNMHIHNLQECSLKIFANFWYLHNTFVTK